MDYDEHGNITGKSDLGYEMQYNDERPHAISGIKGNPSLISDQEQIITYTDFKKIATVSEGDKRLELLYGVDEQRRKAIFKSNGDITLTRFYLGDYEEEETPDGKKRKIHYLSGGDGLSAIYIEEDGNSNFYYAYTDHLGSLTVLTDKDGNVEERQAFDPWGNRRNPNDWTSLITTPVSNITGRGYTMHEHLDGFALINMNGRVYDPQIARFLSPDPQLQAPGYWLNYNRYGYALNNPLMYTDPSGEFFVEAIMLGMYIYTGIQGASGNLQDGRDFLTALAVGGLSGAAGSVAGNAVSGAFGIATTTGGAMTNGAFVGAVGGFAGGFVGGAGGAWAGGSSFEHGLLEGLRGGVFGAFGGAVVGGLSGGYKFNRINREISLKLKAANVSYNGRRIDPTEANLKKVVNGFTNKGLRSIKIGETSDGMGETHAIGNTAKVGRMSDVVINTQAFRNSFQLFNVVGHEMVHVAQYYAGLSHYVPFMEYGAYSWNSFIHDFEGLSMPDNWNEALHNSFNNAMQMNASWKASGYSPLSLKDYLWNNLDFKFNFYY